jgi:hypothetical protein
MLQFAIHSVANYWNTEALPHSVGRVPERPQMPDVSAPSCRPIKAGQELPHVGESVPLSGKLINPSLESAGNAPGSVQLAGIEPTQ